ncbi:MAG: NAD(P)-binding domain-containing protein, partial [Candidatus Dormibacteria bacterium]
MSDGPGLPPRLGWIGAGRMGAAMVRRLLAAGEPVLVYNRTRAKAEPLRELGAELADHVWELGGCPVVFVAVSSSQD